VVHSGDVTFGPNLLHLVLLACALPCVRYTLSEMGRRPLPRWRLTAPVLLAATCALVFLLFHVGSQQPPWIFVSALAAGLAVGLVRGFTLELQVDHMFERVRLTRARGSFLIALVLLAAVLTEIIGAFAGPEALPLRLLTPEVAAACAGMLGGRAIAISLRWESAPHMDLRRR
jgi:membrane protein CcdC involved in cytochrome C biogenesis